MYLGDGFLLENIRRSYFENGKGYSRIITEAMQYELKKTLSLILDELEVSKSWVNAKNPTTWSLVNISNERIPKVSTRMSRIL